jgi:hypothetical protein
MSTRKTNRSYGTNLGEIGAFLIFGFVGIVQVLGLLLFLAVFVAGIISAL